MAPARPGIVCVGLGPGDPDLMSVKADRLVRGALHVAFFRKKGRPGKARELVQELREAEQPKKDETKMREQVREMRRAAAQSI